MKRFFSLLLAVALGLCLSACHGTREQGRLTVPAQSEGIEGGL